MSIAWMLVHKKNARSPSVKDKNIGTQYSGLRTAAKTTRASAVLVTSQLVPPKSCGFETYSKLDTKLCQALGYLSTSGKKKRLTFSAFIGSQFFCKYHRFKKKNSTPCQQCHYASEPRIILTFSPHPPPKKKRSARPGICPWLFVFVGFSEIDYSDFAQIYVKLIFCWRIFWPFKPFRVVWQSLRVCLVKSEYHKVPGNLSLNAALHCPI